MISRFEKVMKGMLGVLVLVSVSCMEEKLPEVHFIIPDEHKGYFRLIVDPVNGVELNPGKKGMTFKIPKDGILKIQEEMPQFSRLQLIAQYENGTKIPTAYSFNMFPDKTLVFYGPHEEEKLTGKEYLFMVATVEDIKKTFGYKKK